MSTARSTIGGRPRQSTSPETSAPTSRPAPTSSGSWFPTVIEPLREDWDRVKVAVMARLGRLESLKTDDARKKAKDLARKELLAFHHALCNTRVLDPACGTGNFLYVAMVHMKRLEGEVLDLLAQLEGTQRLALLSSSGDGPRETVDPHQFLGIEVNGRAAVIAELVLWIGYLQWHYRTFLAASGGGAQWHEPVLRQFGNIEHRDAWCATRTASPSPGGTA
jgi:hypothetical protein